MTRPLRHALLCALLALGLLSGIVSHASAENVTYPGSALQVIEGYDALAPSGSAGALNDCKSTNLTDNTVTMFSGTAARIYGGVNTIDTTPISNNKVIINGGMVSGAASPVVAGGYGKMATNNSVTVNGGIIDNEIAGGIGTTTATGNSVTMNAGTLNGGFICGASGGNLTNNKVTINDGTVNGTVFGAIGDTATNNSVTINGGLIIDISGGWAVNGLSTGNTVTMNSGVTGSISGGEAFNGSATQNHITIVGNSHIGANVYAGYAWSDSSATATHNTLTISGTPTFGATALYGGYTTGAGAGDAFSGNTLNLHSANINVAGLRNFQYLNFYLPSTLTSGSTMLFASGTTDLTDGAGRTATVNVGIDGKRSPLRVGDQVILIDAGSLVGTPENTTANGQGMQGVTLNYEFDIMRVGNRLLATTAKAGVNPQAKALSEGFLAGLALVNQGGNLVAGQGMAQAVNAADGSGFGAFGAFSGGWSRYNTGSHLDMSSVSLVTGISWGAILRPAT